MTAQSLTAKPVRTALFAGLRRELSELSFTPKLAFIVVGDDLASASYVASKARMVHKLGMASDHQALPETVSQADLLARIYGLNQDEEVDGILLQLPLPEGLDVDIALSAIDPAKDVDGLHPENVGRLWLGQETLEPPTAAGLIELLDYYDYPVSGKQVVIIGRSNLVGKPAAALFLRRDATVTLAHSKTKDLAALTRQADILVAAAGQPGLITAKHVKPGVVALDVGSTYLNDKLFGDISSEVGELASGLTPMPGGTGPMTIAMLMVNLVKAARLRRGRG